MGVVYDGIGFLNGFSKEGIPLLNVN